LCWPGDRGHPDDPFILLVLFFVDNVYHKGWPKTGLNQEEEN